VRRAQADIAEILSPEARNGQGASRSLYKNPAFHPGEARGETRLEMPTLPLKVRVVVARQKHDVSTIERTAGFES